ncbi:MAG: MFS transporter [Chloroflexi bacterium]|nr:MFS transporter [Actinomycetota bacterium]MCL5958586.1 MFS transporter [Chloroflexota bacterium]
MKSRTGADVAIDKNSILFVTTLVSFLTPFMSASINIALPSIGNEFAADAVTLSWVATSFILASAMFLVPLGRLADIHGRKRIFVYGIFVYTVASLLSAMASSALALITLRVLQGIGSAMIAGTSVAILTSVFPAGERGRALGINVAAVYSGLSLGPFLGGFLTQNFGWRSIFLVNVPLGLIIIPLTFLKLKGEWAEARGEKFDLTGSVVYSLTLVAVMYGFTLLPGALGMWLFLAGIAGAFAFISLETRMKSPVFDVGLFRHNLVFALSNMAALINYSATSAIGFLLSLYLQYAKGLGPQEAGLVLVSQPIMMTIFSPLAGRISDRIEPRIVASLGMALTAIGLFLFVFLDATTSLEFIVASLVILGFGFALFSSPNTNAVMSSVERKYYGVAAGTLATMRSIGMMLSMGIVMLILTLYVGRVQITPEFYPQFLSSTRMAFTVFAVLCFGGVFASLARGKVR